MTKVTIHSVGSGICALTGKEADGLCLTFEDGTLKEAFLGWKSFRQLLSMKAARTARLDPKPPSGGTTNGSGAGK